MTLFDTHCHLTDATLYHRLPEIIQEASVLGVTHFICPATTSDDWQRVLALASPHITPALGIHPWFADISSTEQLSLLNQYLLENPHILVGEIGLDFFGHRKQTAPQQVALFEAQLLLAQDTQRPVVIHNVRATNACLQSINRIGFTQGGFCHAFSGSIEEAHQWIKHGFKIGIGSLLLNPYAKKIRHTIAHLSLSDCVLETDSPFMSPDKSTANHPKHCFNIAQEIAKIKNIDVEEVIQHTTNNAYQVLQAIGKATPS